jgi:adenylate kinase
VNIVLLGAPGAGKGTQAKSLAEKLGISHISTGDILRQNVKGNTEIGKKAQEYMNQGLLVPDELVTEMLIDRFSRPDVHSGFILDGYPRNAAQAKKLDEILTAKKLSLDYALELSASEKIIIQRLSGRLVCSKCGANFHKTNMPPKEAMICDKCGAALYQRVDDKEDTIRKRLEVYRNEVSPLVEYFKQQHKHVGVPADDDAPVVLDNVLAILCKRA